MSRRTVLRSTLVVAGAGAIVPGMAAAGAGGPEPSALRGSPRVYAMKKSINLWAFPYPARMSLRDCLKLAKDAGFDGIEPNYDLENDISPKAGPADLRAIRRLAEETGIAISGLCSFLYWPYSLSDNDPARRARGLELARLMIEAARAGNGKPADDRRIDLHPLAPRAGAGPLRPLRTPGPRGDRRLLPVAEKSGVSLNIENVFFNGYLTTPDEMNAFVDSFGSKHIGVHFDTGNIMLFQFPEHWIPVLGQRIRNVHFKEFSKKGTDHTLDSFRTLLDGTTNWPAVMEALALTSYSGYLTFEYFHPFPHYPEALIYQTSDALDRILGRKS